MANWLSKFFSNDLVLSDELNRPTQSQRVVVVHDQNQGTHGTRNYSGYLNEEYLSSLLGYRRADEFDKMRRSDSTVIMCLKAVKNLIRSAHWEIEAADDDQLSPADAEADKDLIDHILFKDMQSSWMQFINEVLTCVEFGHATFERTDKIVQNHPKFGTYIGIKNLSWRSPRTIHKWNLDPITKHLQSITQIAYGDETVYVDIPAEFLSVFTIEKEGSNYEGISLIRPCYGSYIRKREYMKLNAIGIEKFAIPTPVAEVPDSQLNGDQFENLKQVLSDFVGHESQFITHPVGWKVTLVSNTYDPAKVEISIDNEDRRMTDAFLCNFLSLGKTGAAGSYAMSNNLTDFFVSGLDYICDIIKEEFNRTIIPNSIKMNRGERTAYPKLICSGVSDKAGKELAETLKFLTDGKIIIADDDLEASIRKRYRFPKKSNVGQRQDNAPAKEPLGTLAENSLYARIKLAEKNRMKAFENERLGSDGRPMPLSLSGPIKESR